MNNLIGAENVDKADLLSILQIQTEIVQEGINLGNIMFLVARRSLEITGADGAVIELKEGEDMVYRATAGIAEPQLGLRLKAASSLSGLCIREGKPVNCRDSETDDRVDRNACQRVGLRSMIVTPLIHNHETVGVLKVLSKKTDRFADKDLQILGLLSQLISAAMYTAGKYGQDELYLKATTDSMTGVRNRSMFYDLLRVRFAKSERTGEAFGVMLFDMDNLKKINDTYGHKAGDDAIIEVAERVKNTLRESDALFRLGGDEFGIIVENLKTEGDLLRLAERIRAAVNRPFACGRNELNLGISLGMALYPSDGTEVNQLVKHADSHMYDEKREKKKAGGDTSRR